MERELTDHEIAELCSFMRVIDLMKKNQNILDEKPELQEMIDKLCSSVNFIMEQLSEEQRDEVLEIHKEQLEEIAKKNSSNPKP